MPALSVLSSVQGIGTGVGRARCLWYAGNGPFSRARQHVLVASFRRAPRCHEANIPPRSPAPLVPAAAGPHPVAARMRVRPSPHRKQRQRPLHHRHAEESSRDLLSLWSATTDPLVTPAPTSLLSFCANHWRLHVCYSVVQSHDVLSGRGAGTRGTAFRSETTVFRRYGEERPTCQGDCDATEQASSRCRRLGRSSLRAGALAVPS